MFRLDVCGRHDHAKEDEDEYGRELEACYEGCATCAGVVDHEVLGICYASFSTCILTTMQHAYHICDPVVLAWRLVVRLKLVLSRDGWLREDF